MEGNESVTFCLKEFCCFEAVLSFVMFFTDGPRK